MGNSYSQRRQFIRLPKIPKKSYEPRPISLNPIKIGSFNPDSLCNSCMKNPIQTRLNCGHTTLCYMCLYMWTQVYNKFTCNICRESIKTLQVPYILEYTIANNSITF